MIEMTIDRSKTHIISFSGGMGSAVSAILAYEQGLKFELVFADTLIEDEDLYRFIKEIAQAVKKEIYWLKDGRTPWQVFADDRKMGNSLNANCSYFLKKKVVQEWMKSHCNKSMPLVLGMGLFEYERIEKARLTWAPRPVVSLLIAYRIANSRYASFIEKYGIEIPRLYKMGFPHNNCGGMCVRAGQKQFATLLDKMPERYKWHEEQELETHAKIPGKRYPFIYKSKDYVRSYLTMKEFREGIESGAIKVDKYTEDTSCSCFVDE